jgi:DNA-binding transcriptional regulator YdaS (Cro superfamily)
VPEIYIRTLQRAAEIVGGEEQLALRLKVTPSHLALWLQGRSEPPAGVCFAAVDLVTDHELSLLSKSEQSR